MLLSVIHCAIALLACVSMRFTQEEPPRLSERQLSEIRTLLRFSNEDVKEFLLEKRTPEEGQPIILKIEFDSGGYCLIDEDSGRVYDFVAPEDSDVENEASEYRQLDYPGEVFDAVAPILKMYGMPAVLDAYEIFNVETLGDVWFVKSRLPSTLSEKSPSLTLIVAGNTGALISLSYLPAAEAKNTDFHVAQDEALSIAERWLDSESPFAKRDPRVGNIKDVVTGVVRGYRQTLDSVPLEELIVTKQIALCWGVPFSWKDGGNQREYYVWVDVGTGEVVDASSSVYSNR